MEPIILLAQSNGQQFLVRCSEHPYRVGESQNPILCSEVTKPVDVQFAELHKDPGCHPSLREVLHELTIPDSLTPSRHCHQGSRTAH